MTQPQLRTRQNDLTRSLIMAAVGDLIAERGVTDFSVQDVADRAGVSHRTVYRHYQTREALLAAFLAWAQARVTSMGGTALPERPDEVAPLVRRKFVALDAIASVVRPALLLDEARLARAEQSKRSAQAMRAALVGLTAHLPRGQAEVVVELIRQIGSSRMWLTLHEELGVSGARSSEAVAWAVETLIEELRAGRGPRGEGPDRAEGSIP